MFATSLRAARLVANDPSKAGRFQIPSLDGIRAISFVIVFASHAGLGQWVPGAFGLTVFFFLSGFLITTLMRIEYERTGSVSLRDFYLRRVLRILPPFYLVLATATALAAIGWLRGDEPLRLGPVAAQWLHLTNYWVALHGAGGIPSGTGVYWSLAVEEHFYLLFPIVFLLLHKARLAPRQIATAFWAMCIAVLLWRCVLVADFHAGDSRTYMGSDTRIDSIAFGCALAVWNNPFLDRADHESPRRGRLWASFLVAGAFALLVATFVLRGASFRQTLRYSLQGVALTPLFFAAVRWPTWGLCRMLNWTPLRVLGTLSYSLYLVHQCVLALVEQHLPFHGVMRAFVAFAISVAFAGAVYAVVERPCVRLRRRLAVSCGAPPHIARPALAPSGAIVSTPSNAPGPTRRTLSCGELGPPPSP